MRIALLRSQIGLPLYKGDATSSLPLIEIDSFMDRKAVTLCVLICLVVAFLLSISNYYIYLMRSPVQALPGFVALILRDGALIFLSPIYIGVARSEPGWGVCEAGDLPTPVCAVPCPCLLTPNLATATASRARRRVRRRAQWLWRNDAWLVLSTAARRWRRSLQD
jgi:hypothetical protein